MIRLKARTPPLTDIERELRDPKSLGDCARALVYYAEVGKNKQATNILEKNIPLLGEGIKSGEWLGECAEALCHIVICGSKKGERTALAALGKNIPELENGLERKSSVAVCFRALRYLVDHADEDTGMLAFDALERGLKNETSVEVCAGFFSGFALLGGNKCAMALGVLERGLKNKTSVGVCAEALPNVMISADKDTSKLALDVLERNIPEIGRGLDSETSFAACTETLCCLMLMNPIVGQKRDSILKVVKDFISKSGLDGDEVLAAWAKSAEKEPQGRSYRLSDNLHVLKAIETQRPGAAKTLCDEFGIMDFGRYTAGMLVRQYDERDETGRPYGIVIFPRNDYNAAYYKYNQLFGGLSTQLSEHGISLRVIECEGKMGVARKLITLDRRYGREHKISFALIGGHGTKDSIQFGGGDEAYNLYTNDLLGRGVRKTSGFFIDNPTLILASCSTGVEGGIAQELSKLGAIVFAPVAVSFGVDTINFEIRDGKPVFNIAYAKNVGTAYTAGEPANKTNQ